jgi:predicted secreted protein
VSLPDNPTTGFAWHVEPAVSATVLEQVGEPSFRPSSSALGAGGTMTFEFLATGPGLVTLHLVYDRSFEAGSTQDEWTATVLVRGQQAVAWYGTVANEPTGGLNFALEVLDGGSVAVPIIGSDGQTANALTGYAATGAPVLVLGELTCDSSHPGCQIDAVRLVAADSQAAQPAIPVVGWSGTVHAVLDEAGGDYFQQAGRFPVQYGIEGATAAVETQLAEVRASGQPIRVWGELRGPTDDIHRTLISVTEIALAPLP